MAVTYDSIATTTLGSNTTTVTFSSISSAYTDLIIVCDPATVTDGSTVYFRVNGDSGTSYSWTSMQGNGSTASSSKTAAANRIELGPVMGVSSTLGRSMLIINLQSYSNTTTFKNIIARQNNASSGSFPGTSYTGGIWRSTSAINSISFTTNATQQLAGATFTIYGILKA